MPTSAWVINLVVLTAVLEADLGHRKITPARLARPVILAGVFVGIYLSGVATRGDGLRLELGLAALGVILGVIAGSFVRVSRGSDGAAWSTAGIAYAALWILVIGARLGFTYATIHSHSLDRWFASHAIAPATLTSALIFMAATLLLTRTGGLLIRGRAVREGAVAAEGAPTTPVVSSSAAR